MNAASAYGKSIRSVNLDHFMGDFLEQEKSVLAGKCGNANDALPQRLDSFFDRLLERIECYHPSESAMATQSGRFSWRRKLEAIEQFGGRDEIC